MPGRENEISAIQLSSHERGSRDLPKFSERAREEAGRNGERFPVERASSFGLHEKQSRASVAAKVGRKIHSPVIHMQLRGFSAERDFQEDEIIHAARGPIGFTVIGINRLFDLLGVMRRIVSPVRGISGKTAG